MKTTLKIRANVIIHAISPYISKKSKVLDIGCGNGIVAEQIKDHFKCKIAGTDIVNYLKKSMYFKKIQKRNKLDFKNNEFDVGMINDVLHHVKFGEQIQVIKEALRVCKTVLIFELKETLVSKGLDYLLNKIHNPDMPVPFTYRTKKNWERLFVRNKIKFSTHDVETPFWFPNKYYLFVLKKS